MKFIKIEGLQDAYPERIDGTSEWYYCKMAKNCFCDLHEAEEIVKAGHVYEGMNCVLIHFPDGKVFRPFETRQNVYVDAPVFWDGKLYFLVVDFSKRWIEIIAVNTRSYEKNVVAGVSLEEVEDCYNLMLRVAPVILVRDGNKNVLEVVYPEKKRFEIGNHEVMLFRDGNQVYFSDWYEDPVYHERTIVRDWNTGEVTESFEGQVCRIPNGDVWVI